MPSPSLSTYKCIARAAACLCAVLSLAAQAKDMTCYSTEFPPYVISKDNQISGIDVDVVAEAGRRAGVVVNFKLLPWVRLENELKKGAASEVECAFSYSKNTARKTYMDFTTVPVKLSTYVLFARKNTFTGNIGLLELKGKTIGLRRGFIVPGEFEEMRRRKEFFIDEIDSDAANFTKLEKGRIDGIMTNAEVGYAMLAQLGIHSVIAIEPAIEKIPTYLVFNKDKNLAVQLMLFNKTLKEIMADGSYQKIHDKYIQKSVNSQ